MNISSGMTTNLNYLRKMLSFFKFLNSGQSEGFTMMYIINFFLSVNTVFG